MEPESKESIARRQRRVITLHAAEIALAGSFVLSVIAADRIAEHAGGLILRLVALVLPVLFLTLWFSFYAWYIRSLSDFEQSIATRALAIAFGLTVWVATIWGLCDVFLQAPTLPLTLIAPLAAVIYAVSRGLLAASYR